MDLMGLMQQLGVAPTAPGEMLDLRKGWYLWRSSASSTSLLAVKETSRDTRREMDLGNRSHKEWLEGHNPAIIEEIYAPDCILYAKHIPRAQKFGHAGFTSSSRRVLYTAFPDMAIEHEMVAAEEERPVPDEDSSERCGWRACNASRGQVPATGRKVVPPASTSSRIENREDPELLSRPGRDVADAELERRADLSHPD